MLLIQLLYRYADKNGSKTAALSDKLNFHVKSKFLLQIGSMFGVVIVLGSIFLLFRLDADIFYVLSGAAVGLIHALSAAVMRNR